MDSCYLGESSMRNMSWSLVELPNPLTEEPKGITWSGQVKKTWWKVVFLTSQEEMAAGVK